MIHLLLSLVAMTYAAETVHPKYVSTTVRLHDQHAYIQKNAAPDYWAISPYYWPQQRGSSCSVASVTMLVNAARSSMKLTAADELATENGLLKKVNSKEWNQCVGDGGHGVTLDQLGSFVKEALKSYGFKNPSVQVIHADGKPATHQKILKLLAKNEKTAKDFILANFLQSEYTGDPEGAVGHIAPVGAYDQKTQKVLVMDPDREYYEPYWVSVDTFIKGLSTHDQASNANRGIVYVELNR